MLRINSSQLYGLRRYVRQYFNMYIDSTFQSSYRRNFRCEKNGGTDCLVEQRNLTNYECTWNNSIRRRGSECTLANHICWFEGRHSN